MRKNKIILIICVICLLPALLFAKEKFNPESVVVGLIQTAQNNDLNGLLHLADLVKIASQPYHSRQPEELVEFFKEIDLNQIKFEKKQYKIGDDKILVRILKPISCDFELEAQKFRRQDGRIGHRYRVVHVHP